jgi:hypothetical protein
MHLISLHTCTFRTVVSEFLNIGDFFFHFLSRPKGIRWTDALWQYMVWVENPRDNLFCECYRQVLQQRVLSSDLRDIQYLYTDKVFFCWFMLSTLSFCVTFFSTSYCTSENDLFVQCFYLLSVVFFYLIKSQDCSNESTSLACSCPDEIYLR